MFAVAKAGTVFVPGVFPSVTMACPAKDSPVGGLTQVQTKLTTGATTATVPRSTMMKETGKVVALAMTPGIPINPLMMAVKIKAIATPDNGS